ncbi:MAG: hypothetical protein ACE5FO_00130 [Parvularculaceae bacterium]
MDVIFSDLVGVARSVFLGGDWINLAMVIVAALIGALMMRSLGQLFGVSVAAMIIFALAQLIYGGATSATPTDPQIWLGQLESGWASMMETSGRILVGYFVVFAVAVMVLFFGKSLVFRE